MSEYEIYSFHRDFLGFHDGIESLRIRELNRMDQPPRILLIDDEEHVLANLCYYLNYRNYDVSSTSDGLEGLKLIENDQHRFELVITDIVMPKISGISLISIIKTKFPSMPIIAITGWGEYPEAFAIESQADKVLSKPFELSELDKAINELVFFKECNDQQ